ncbi:MAG: M20/M25/M40 family metallo-hydrolase [Symbiobacteriaceae bacterium]|nr:M20/M25/M40 family metallo-hydrolase [Symbiobacteriaceae bacterium]
MDYIISSKVAEAVATLTKIPEVQQGLAFLEADHPRTVQENLEMVVVKAPTFAEHQRAELFAHKLQELGLEGVHVDRHQNAIGIKRGYGNGPTILVEAHLDTVFPMDAIVEPEIKKNIIHAPGICDDTRGLVAILSLIRALQESGVKHGGDIYFVGTAREEGMGGFGGMKDLFDDHAGVFAASVSIDGSNVERICFNATGIKTFTFNFYGVGGHAYGAFGKVANPLHAAARAVAKISVLKVPTEPKTTYAVSNFHAGNDAGIHAIVDKATIKINIRSTGKAELEELEQQIHQCVADACREETEFWGCDTITFDCVYHVNNPAGTSDRHLPIVEATYAIMKHLGTEPVFAPDGSTNASVPIVRGIPAVCLGSGGQSGGVHTTQEWYDPTDAFIGPQQTLLLALALSGIEGKLVSLLL